MKKKAGITRRRLAQVIGAAAAVKGGATGARAQTGEGRPGRLRAALEKVRRAAPGRNISPAFRFIP